MQGIAYIRESQPVITWPAVTDIMDEEGNPTGEQTSNIDALIAALPEGTDYTLVEEEGAAAWVAANTPPEVQQAAMLAAFTDAIQRLLDSFAQTRNYDGILSAATYATSTVPKFAAEGQYAVEARDSTWAGAYAILDAVLVGVRPMPSIEEVIAELPVLAWPEV